MTHPLDLGPEKQIVNKLLQVSPGFLGELSLWLQQNPPSPVQTITVNGAPYIGATESTTSTAFTDLATVGPTLSGLSNGQYLVLFGCTAKSGAGDEADMGIMVNSNAVDATQTTVTLSTAYTSLSFATVVSLSSGSNSITAKYLSAAGGTASFGRRWLIAVRFSN